MVRSSFIFVEINRIAKVSHVVVASILRLNNITLPELIRFYPDTNDKESYFIPYDDVEYRPLKNFNKMPQVLHFVPPIEGPALYLLYTFLLPGPDFV